MWRIRTFSGLCLAAAMGVLPPAAAEMNVVNVAPAANGLAAPVDAAITIQLDRPVDPATVTDEHVWAFGRWSGPVPGALTLTGGGTTVRLTPDRLFSAGEQVMVIVSNDLRGVDGEPLRPGGYSWQFWTQAGFAPLRFEHTQTLDTNAGPESSRPYGGVATDFSGDGWLDLAIVNEDTADLRVFLNDAGGFGGFEPFLQPTSPLGPIASPSEPGDFNHDGHADICVANQADRSVSILLGDGDGTFAPQQRIVVGNTPRGIAVLDADGDGDMDIVNTNYGSSSVSLLLNDGSGVFGAPVFFEGGGAGERALSAADMNEDGLLDLVVGTRDDQRIRVLTGHGDGTFTHVSSQSAGGALWMFAVGDVNGDGHADVTSANSFSNNGAVLLGDGAGNLGPPETFATDAFPLATDLGDLDGDGDLDWVTSSYQGDWTLFVNDGAGGFTFDREFPAPVAASCALAADVDNDGDLDLALVDEEADVVIIQRNSGSGRMGDLNCDGALDAFDVEPFVLALFDAGEYERRYPDCDRMLGDVSGDGAVDGFDIEPFVALLFP